MRAAFPEAQIFAIGSMSAAQAEQLCHDYGMKLMATEHGNVFLSSATPVSAQRGSSLPSDGAGVAAGPGYPEAA